jgi:hypothetical protein
VTECSSVFAVAVVVAGAEGLQADAVSGFDVRFETFEVSLITI